jgi:hypothetical protein
MDTHEASVWQVVGNPALVKRIRQGKVTEAQLMAAGAVQRGLAAGDLAAAKCPATGNGCVNFYAVSIPGVTPSRFITWFQAAAAARNSGKRLPTNAEWQAAALGTPDGAPCNVSSGAGAVADTGTAGCVSDVGAFDMVGNLGEWVADWVPRSDGTCPGWGAFSGDLMCISGAAITAGGPGALIRGGNFISGAVAGVFAVDGAFAPSFSDVFIGFRAAR